MPFRDSSIVDAGLRQTDRDVLDPARFSLSSSTGALGRCRIALHVSEIAETDIFAPLSMH